MSCWPCSPWPSQQGQEAAETAGVRVAMPLTGASALWVPGPVKKRLKIPKPASLELTPLPGQVPPPPGLGCRHPGSTSPKPTVLGDALGWRGSRGRAAASAAWRARAGVPHAPDLRSSIASTPMGAEDGGAQPGSVHAAGQHIAMSPGRTNRSPGSLHRAAPTHRLQDRTASCSWAPGISTTCIWLRGCRHHPCSPPASRTFPPPRGCVSATNALSTGAPAATQRSWDASHFARGPARAWLCCVSVLAVS